MSLLLNLLYVKNRQNVYIKGKNYNIHIQYGDLFEMNKCKKIIPFDECFTTSVGKRPEDIKSKSICGQYLEKNPIHDMQALINNAQLKPQKNKSKYQGKECYESGRLVPRGDDLLLAFAKLDKDGLGKMSQEEYINCLSVLWKEIDKYYGQRDICIPVLGSGITRMDNTLLTQQELLDIIISSYKISPYKIKAPYKLHIVCREVESFSLSKVEESL